MIQNMRYPVFATPGNIERVLLTRNMDLQDIDPF